VIEFNDGRPDRPFAEVLNKVLDYWRSLFLK
jgi:hypothetical protein